MSRLIVAYPLADFENSEFSHWPLHVTLLHWFYIEAQRIADFREDIERVATSSSPISTRISHEEMFGENADIAVNVIAPTVALRSLHNQLLQVAESHDGKLEAPQWCGQNYRPHVTHQESVSSLTGSQEIVIDSFALVEATSDSPFARRVLDIYNLSNK